MIFTADFHIHSKYSRETSKDMDVETISRWARFKGVDLIAAGDITHPTWLLELKTKLKPLGNGIFKYNETSFILAGEVCNVFKRGDDVKKVHSILFVPSFEVLDKINRTLAKYGDLIAEGRPVLKMDVSQLVQLVLDVSSDCLVVPAHIWAPWFSLFSAGDGFNSLDEAYGSFAKYVYAAETGLSSDPKMNWRLSALDRITMLSGSDAHSPEKIGREATVFDGVLHYHDIKQIIQYKNRDKILYTLEYYTEENKFHLDGHKKCGVSYKPSERKKLNGICPVCKTPLSTGILSRVTELADREEGAHSPKAISYKSLVPLQEIIAEGLRKITDSPTVMNEYLKMLERGGSEYNILLRMPEPELRMIGSDRVVDGILNARKGSVRVYPGYDGEKGKVRVFDENDTADKQMAFF